MVKIGKKLNFTLFVTGRAKKRQVTYIAPLQPFTLAAFLPWGSSIGAGRIRLAGAKVEDYNQTTKKKQDFNKQAYDCKNLIQCKFLFREVQQKPHSSLFAGLIMIPFFQAHQAPHLKEVMSNPAISNKRSTTVIAASSIVLGLL